MDASGEMGEEREQIDGFDTNEWRYGLMVVDPESINYDEDHFELLHLALYKEEPTQADIDYLRTELREDEVFGVGHIADRVRITIITGDKLEYLLDMMSKDDDV